MTFDPALERFPLLIGTIVDDPAEPWLGRADARRLRTLHALQTLAAAAAAGTIRKVALDELKHTLGNEIENARTRCIGAQFFRAGKYEQQSDEANTLYGRLSLSSLHSVLSAHKLLAKVQSVEPSVQAMRALVEEVLPLAQAAEFLKDKVVKGRAPSAGPAKPMNPNKVVKTCACCFRSIALAGATMAHHGYERPGTGWQTASCPGTRFRPLEVSDDGLRWVIGQRQARYDVVVQSLQTLPHAASLTVQRGPPGRWTLETLSREHPDFHAELRSHLSELEWEHGSLKHELRRLRERLAAWKPQPTSPQSPRAQASHLADAFDAEDEAAPGLRP